MSCLASPDLCGCGDAKVQRACRANAIISTGSVLIIALIDNVAVPVPASVTGLDSAMHWLERNFAQAETAEFYRAERIADHPTMICGGVYAPTTELAFLSRRVAP